MTPSQLTRAQAFGRTQYAEALDLLRTLARIPSPTHHEERRAAFICDWMQRNGLTGATIDQAKNVICPLYDDGTADLVVFAAHTDVVFDDTDELPLREENGRLYAPGVGDDTANLVALLLAARELAHHPELLPQGMGALIVANSCEEGLGNLAGTRQLFASYGARVKRFYSFDLYLPGCVDTAVGSHRWEICVHTQGGHSFHDFGRPNAIERLCALVEDLYKLELPAEVPATLNVGTIEGGTGVNAIAAQARALFEYRSTSDAVLHKLDDELQAVVEHYRTDDVTVTLTDVGQRPASAEGRSDELVRMTDVSCAVLRAITGEEPELSPASTDANIPLSLGIPANTLGAIRGAMLHTRDEWIEAASLQEGLAVVMGIMLAQAELEG